VAYLIRHILETLLVSSTALVLLYVAMRAVRAGKLSRTKAGILLALAYGFLLFGLAMDTNRMQVELNPLFGTVYKALYLAAMVNVLGIFCLWTLYRTALGKWQEHSAGRRNFLKATYAAPAAVLGYGTFIERERFQLREVDLPVANLPRGLEGLRIAQVTDIHIGEFLPERDLERVIDMVNGTRPHLAVMTGDLVTKFGDPVDACLRQLQRIKSDAGLYGCMGNHELYSELEDYVESEAARMGMLFLRNRARTLSFGGDLLHISGVDYQSKRLQKSYLEGAEQLIRPDATNLLLSHNPDTFRVAPDKNFQVQLSGHTHGGQIAVEILNPYLNVARFVTPYVAGYYHERGSSLYVSRGIGTIGLPVRAGVPPEVTLLRLRRMA
jgi:predicted MPP superfamily phosphohydrolase